MTNIFRIIVTMSFSSAIVIIFILAIRQLLKHHLSKSFTYGLWILVLLRLLLPISFESNFSILNFINTPESITTTEDNTPEVNNTLLNENNLFITNELNTYNDFKTIDLDPSLNVITTTPPIENEQQSLMTNQIDVISEDNLLSNTNIMTILSSIWFIIMLLVFMFFVIHHLRFYRLLKDATIFKINSKHPVFTSDKVDSPIIHGFIHTKIILPSYYNFNEEELAYVLAHEAEHIKRFDHIVKPISLILVCIHWFNPLVWIAFFISMKDMELSCDERVLEKYDKTHQVNYANTLLNMSLHQNQWRINPMVAFGEKNTKTRIKSAVSFKSISMKVKLLGIAIILILAIVLISDPRNDNNAEPDAVNENTLDKANNEDSTNTDAVIEISEEEVNESVVNTDLGDSVQYTYKQLTDLAEEYDYERAIVFSETSEEVIVLAYNTEFSNGLLIHTDKDLIADKVEDFKTNEALVGFNFSFKYGDFRNQEYLLGVLSQEADDGSIISKIVSIPKNDLSNLYILGEYNMPYQSQGEIPTIIDFTLTISGEYISYFDIDSYLKVQHIKTGALYVSNDNTTRIAEAIPMNLIHAPVEKYMPVIEYQDSSGYLYFNRDTKTFITGTLVEGNEDTITFDSLSDQLIPLNDYLIEQQLFVEQFFVFRTCVIVYANDSHILCYDFSEQKTYNISNENSKYQGIINIKRLTNNDLAIMTADKILFYDEIERTLNTVKTFDKTKINTFDISIDGTKVTYTTTDDELFIEDLIAETKTQIDYKKDFDTSIRGIQPIFSRYDYSIAFIIIGNLEGQTLAIVDPDYSIHYTHIEDSLGHSSTIEWLRNGSIAYISDYATTFLEPTHWEIIKEIERYEGSEIEPSVSVGGRYLLYENSDGELESYDCLTMETAVVVKQATGSNYQYAEVKEEIVGLDYNRQSLTVE